MSARRASPWFLIPEVEPQKGQITLVLFPHAGANASLFRPWLQSERIGMWTLIATLPGRGARLSEPPVKRFDLLVEELMAALKPVLPRRYALFGHSLGAYVAFEIARRLPTEPAVLFVSGATPPQQRLPAERPRAEMSDAELVDELRRLGGTPPEILQHPELLELLMPSIRADFELADDYVYRPGPPLSCPVHALGGAHDTTTAASALPGWLEHSKAPGQVKTFDGGHFYVHERENELMTYVASTLNSPGMSRIKMGTDKEGP